MELLCRSVNRLWVAEVKKHIKVSPASPPVIIPCLVDHGDVAVLREFDANRDSQCKLYCLGGIHITTTLQSEGMVQVQHWDMQVDLFMGLTQQQSQWLGNGHNMRCETLRPSFFDQVFQARRLLTHMSEVRTGSEPPEELPRGFRTAFAKETGRDYVVRT